MCETLVSIPHGRNQTCSYGIIWAPVSRRFKKYMLKLDWRIFSISIQGLQKMKFSLSLPNMCWIYFSEHNGWSQAGSIEDIWISTRCQTNKKSGFEYTGGSKFCTRTKKNWLSKWRLLHKSVVLDVWFRGKNQTCNFLEMFVLQYKQNSKLLAIFGFFRSFQLQREYQSRWISHEWAFEKWIFRSSFKGRIQASVGTMKKELESRQE